MPPISRPGFTLVELLVAIVLVAIGALAAVTSSAVIVREQDDGRAAAVAASAALNRLEWLRSRPCILETGHAEGAKGISEWWASTPPSPEIRRLSDSVVFVAAGRPRVFVLSAQAWC